MIGIGVGAGAYVLTRFAVSRLLFLIKLRRPPRPSGGIQSAPYSLVSLRDRLSFPFFGLVFILGAADLK